MKLFGFTITRTKAAGALQSVPSRGSWLTFFSGGLGFQRPETIQDPIEQLTAFSAVFACVSKISADIAKLRIRLMEFDSAGVWAEVLDKAPFLPVLRKPNHYQTRIQFLQQWLISLLLHGNAYILKDRDERGVVRALYVLDPQRVCPLVADDGSVFYRLSDDYLAGVREQIIIPAREIIHDRWTTLWHPLVGVSPIYACAVSATQGRRIQSNSSKFFENMSRPSGVITAPGTIDDVTAKRIKTEFEANFSGGKIGRLLVAGDGLTYSPMTIPAEDAQLIEQLKWTVEDVARCFQMPLWKINAGPMPAYGNSEIGQRAYYAETLQNPIESIELLLDEGLELPAKYGTEFDLKPLLRMDTAARMAAHSAGVGAGVVTPNEARAEEGLPPVPGGDTPYLQVQNYALSALAKRDAKEDPFEKDSANETEVTPQPPAKGLRSTALERYALGYLKRAA